jgi:hypothetical protein
MNRGLVRAVASVLVTTAVLVMGLTGCGPLTGAAPSGSAKPHIVRVNAPPSLLEVLIDRDSPAARAQFRTLLTLTTRPNEHVIVRDADTGHWIASFTAPAGPSIAILAPPKPPPAGATQYQTDLYDKAVASYDRELRRAQALLHSRWAQQLASWVAHVVSGSGRDRDSGSQAGPETRGLVRGLAGAAADIYSLEHVPVELGTRKVIAILGFDGVPTATPLPLSSTLGGATVVITDFSGSSQEDADWSEQFTRDGATNTILLTQAVSAGVCTVVEQGL